MEIDRNQGEAGADADAVDPSNDLDPMNVAGVVETQRSGGAQKAEQNMVSKRHHARDIPPILVDTAHECIQDFRLFAIRCG